MSHPSFPTTAPLEIIPAPNSAHTNFDFFSGTWRVHNKKLKTRLNDCTEWIEFEAASECHNILNGFGNTDQFIAEINGVPIHGATFRLFNPKTKLWSIYWADSNVVVLDVPQVGSFDGDIGNFYAWDVFENKPIIVLYQWDKTNPDAPIWSQAFSHDNGATWEWNWHMYFTRERE